MSSSGLESTKFRIAFIGAGYMSFEHVRAFADIEKADLVGIYNRTRSRADDLALDSAIPLVVDTIAELYERTHADLVVISVSELAVREVCEQAFKFPWMCLIEKPAGYDVNDAEAIANFARNKGTRAYVALNRRHYSSTRAVSEQLEEVHEKRWVHIVDQENPAVALESGTPKLVVDNWMYANSIHLIDYFRVFCRGEITKIERVSTWERGTPCVVLTKISFSSGDTGIYEAVWEGPGPWMVSITTPSRRWEMKPLEVASYQDYKSRELLALEVHKWDLKFKPGLRQQAEEAMRALSGASHKLPSLDEALLSMKLVQDIYGH